MRSLRLLWMALILVLVVPLYGQVSCNRSCPPSSNPCQVAAGRSIETGQCVYSDLDGATCDNGGVAGTCYTGLCVPSECIGEESYGICDSPINLQDVQADVGACVEDLCVAAVPYDECVRVGVGRVNCCSQDGCASASGAHCTQPLLDDTPCDPTGVEPPGQPGQDGLCRAGTCVAQTGPCADRACATTVDDPCARKYCDPDIAQCAEWPIESFSNVNCYGQGFEGVCSGGGCVRYEDPARCGAVNGVGGIVCDDGDPCTHNDCIVSVGGGVSFCSYPRKDNGEPCDGGVCFYGYCMRPLFCERGDADENGSDDDCEDGSPCTQNTCDPFGGICNTLIFDDGTPCVEGQGGLCRRGVCLPDLCIDRDCDDGNSCTGDPDTGEDICISPYGICSSPALPDGTPCENNGECGFGGICIPGIECVRDIDCNDNRSCTADTCDNGACNFTNLPNGTPCENNGQCLLGSCIGGIGL